MDEQGISQDSGGSDLANWIWYNLDYRRAEQEVEHMSEDDGAEEDVEDESEGEESEDLVANDKYLIFITGYKTYSPHQIGM